MNFSAACPSCGAALDLAEQTTRVVCPFCGTQFELDLSNANPHFRKGEPRADSPEVFVPQDSDIFTPPVPDPQADPANIPNQPDNFAPVPGQTFDIPFYVQTATRMVGPRLWIGLGIAAFVIFCVSCLCMVALVRLVFGSVINF